MDTEPKPVSADHAIFCILSDLITALYPDPAEPYTVRSVAIDRLRLVKRDGWHGLTARLAALGASLALSTDDPGRAGVAHTEKPLADVLCSASAPVHPSLPRPNDLTLHHPHGVTLWFDTNEQRAAFMAALEI